MGTVAAVVAGLTSCHAAMPPWYELAGFVFAACLLASRTIRLSETLGSVSVGFVFVFAALLELGPLGGAIVAAASAVSGTLLCSRKRRPRPVVVLAALANIVLAAGSAAWTYLWLDTACLEVGIATGLLPAFVAVGVYYMVNSLGVALMASTSGERSVLQVWSDNLSWTVLPFYVGGAVVMVVHLVGLGVGPWVWLALIPLVSLIHIGMELRTKAETAQPVEERQAAG
jgi:hypothetical protein